MKERGMPEMSYIQIMNPQWIWNYHIDRYVMTSTKNKRKLIQLLCENSTFENVHMIGEENCMFGHEEADVNIISYILYLVQKQKKRRIPVIANDSDIFALYVYFCWK